MNTFPNSIAENTDIEYRYIPKKYAKFLNMIPIVDVTCCDGVLLSTAVTAGADTLNDLPSKMLSFDDAPLIVY